MKALWSVKLDFPYTCVDIDAFIISVGTINMVTDILCTLLPVAVVVNLNMPTRQRLAVASVFLVAGTADVASILRIYYSVKKYENNNDMWDFYQPAIASILEIGLGQLCVNLPTLRPLLLQFIAIISSGTRGYDRTEDFYGYNKTGGNLGHDASESWIQHTTYAGTDTLKPLEDEFRGIKVVHTVELDSTDFNDMDEETAKDAKNVFDQDGRLLRH